MKKNLAKLNNNNNNKTEYFCTFQTIPGASHPCSKRNLFIIRDIAQSFPTSFT